MNTRKGIVQHTDNGQAWILAQREGACGNCTHGGCCVAVNGQNRILVRARNEIGARPGDTVGFYLAERIKLKWMAILFAVPVIGAILGASFGSVLANAMSAAGTDGVVAVSTLGGFAAGLAMVWFLGRHAAKELTPVIVHRKKSGA